MDLCQGHPTQTELARCITADYGKAQMSTRKGEMSGVLFIKEATKRGYKEALPGDTVNLSYAGSNTRRGRVGHDIAHTLETSCAQGVVERCGRIRRLMPRECLRLQGFAEEQIDRLLAITSDAQAYKQAGNSVTVNVIEAIGRNLRAVDEELRQFSVLETDILTNGCYSPIVVDEELRIIDGHHRQKICAEHNIPYTMMVFSFEDLLEARQWALATQKGRRNLTLWELGQIALKLKPDIAARAKENQGTRSDLCMNSGESPDEKIDTRQRLADPVGISRDTMNRVMQIDKNAPAVVKEALDNKELSVNQGYNITRQLQQLPEEQREAAAIDAVELAKAKAQIRKADAETDEKARISTLFSKAFGRAVLLEATEDNVRAWVEFSCMDPSDMEDMIKESRELSGTFAAIGDILEQKILPTDWRCDHEPDSAESKG